LVVGSLFFRLALLKAKVPFAATNFDDGALNLGHLAEAASKEILAVRSCFQLSPLVPIDLDEAENS